MPGPLKCTGKSDRSRSSLPAFQDQKAQRMDCMVSNYSDVEIGYITDDSLCDVWRHAEGLLPRATRPIWQCLFAREAPITPFRTEESIPVSWIARHRFSPRIPRIWKRRMLEFSLRLATLSPS